MTESRIDFDILTTLTTLTAQARKFYDYFFLILEL